jgi:uncharacterized lipoprotein NlpE involved in copper resistance
MPKIKLTILEFEVSDRQQVQEIIRLVVSGNWDANQAPSRGEPEVAAAPKSQIQPAAQTRVRAKPGPKSVATTPSTAAPTKKHTFTEKARKAQQKRWAKYHANKNKPAALATISTEG